MGSECRAAWSDLPSELLAMISDGLKETLDITGFRGVCRSWRSSVSNKISPLYPHNFQFNSPHRHYLFTNSVYLLRSNNKKNGSSWIVSVQESKSGKLRLLHPLTSDPIPGFSGFELDMSSGLTRTRLSISHTCPTFTDTKIVLCPNPADGNSMTLFGCRRGQLCALRRCLSDTPSAQLVAQNSVGVQDFVGFNGCVYAVDFRGVVYVVNDGFQLLRLTCVNKPKTHWGAARVGKRFVVSDGDLYLVFGFCKLIVHNLPHNSAPQRSHFYHVYKLKLDMNDMLYNLDCAKNLGDKLFFINKNCSFSVSARDLPPFLVGNCILVGRSAFHNCRCISGFTTYQLEGMASSHPKKHHYSSLFFKHPNKLQRVVSQIKRKRGKNKRTSDAFPPMKKTHHRKGNKRARTSVN